MVALVELFKKIIPSDSFFYRMLSFLYNYRKDFYKPPITNEDISELIKNYTKYKPAVKFIQVGSNDGVSNDPLNKFIESGNWSGFCIEPIPDNIKKLKSNYKYCENVRVVEAAIGEDGFTSIFAINPEKAKKLGVDIPPWYSQLASFNRDLVVSDIRGDCKDQIIDEITVKTFSFTSFIDHYNISRIDLLHIDVEGADWFILSKFPFNNHIPDIIIFEHNHLCDSDYKDAVYNLKNKGYFLLRSGTDTFCFHRNLKQYFTNIPKRRF